MAMRRSILFAAATALSVAVSCLAQTSPTARGEKAPEFSLTVDPPASPMRLRSPINVTVTVINISGREIYWSSERGKETVYKAFNVSLMKDNREVETTYFDRLITDRLRPGDPDPPPGALISSSILLPHAPGRMFVMTIDLTRLYNITEPGLYTLNVSRFDEYSKITVRAKPLNLNILP
jgi:hypothetical protein